MKRRWRDEGSTRWVFEANQVIEEASVPWMQIKTTPSLRNLICRWEERTLHEPNGWLIASDWMTDWLTDCLSVWRGRMWMRVWWTAGTRKIWYASKLINELLPADSGAEQTKLPLPVRSPFTRGRHTFINRSSRRLDNYQKTFFRTITIEMTLRIL